MDLWVKIIHILAVISWMAALLYLPRLFVNHTKHQHSQSISEIFKGMELRLTKVIMRPAALVTWLTGLYLSYKYGYWSDCWFHAKLLAVILLTVSHGTFEYFMRKFQREENNKSESFFRMINEVPTILMIIIVILVILKPF